MSDGSEVESEVETQREAERIARVALCRLAEPGNPKLAALVAEQGALRVHAHLAAERDVGGMLTDVAARLAGLDGEAELSRARDAGIRFVIPGDVEWPRQLDSLARAPTVQERGGVPLGLWVRGPLSLEQLEGSVAVVGSRSATSYGGRIAGELGVALAQARRVVVSGAAFGIDQAAHRGALAGAGATVAVLACGVDRAYPASHRELLRHIAETGAVISELPPGCAPMRVRFLSRNRIIAGLAQAVVVVEAALRSGALNTANWGFGLNRPVLGVPGPVSSAQSEGVHQLIREGGAALVTSGADVLEAVGRPGEHLPPRRRGEVRVRDRLRPREAQVLDAVPVGAPAGAESIARTAGVGAREVEATLERLQRADLVDRLDGGWVLGHASRPADVVASAWPSRRHPGVPEPDDAPDS